MKKYLGSILTISVILLAIAIGLFGITTFFIPSVHYKSEIIKDHQILILLNRSIDEGVSFHLEVKKGNKLIRRVNNFYRSLLGMSYKCKTVINKSKNLVVLVEERYPKHILLIIDLRFEKYFIYEDKHKFSNEISLLVDEFNNSSNGGYSL